MKTWAKLMPVNIRLLRKSMYGTRDATSNVKSDWQRHMPNWYKTVRHISQNLFHHEAHRRSGMTHGDDGVITGLTSRMIELKIRRQNRYSIKGHIIAF